MRNNIIELPENTYLITYELISFLYLLLIKTVFRLLLLELAEPFLFLSTSKQKGLDNEVKDIAETTDTLLSCILISSAKLESKGLRDRSVKSIIYSRIIANNRSNLLNNLIFLENLLNLLLLRLTSVSSDLRKTD